MNIHSNKRKKIAIVVQRCGKDIVAGAEIYAYELAQAIHQYAPEFNVDIYTSKSDNYIRWNNKLPLTEKINDHVCIYRFPVVHTRLLFMFRIIKRISIYLKKFFYPLYFLFSDILDYLFLRTQGPWCPMLWNELIKNHSQYSLVIVKSYLYIPNVKVVTELANKTKVLFIVTAHNESEFKFHFVGECIKKAYALGFVSLAEEQLCKKIWPHSMHKPHFILPPGLKPYTQEFKEKCNNISIKPAIQEVLKLKFFLCLGRIDKNKNSPFLFKNTPQDHLVVFAGEQHLTVPNDSRFRCLGIVTEQEKYLLLKHCIALLVVSRFEAYSIVTAEAISLNCFVLALKGCLPVDELIQSYGGLSVDGKGFVAAMHQLYEDTLNVQKLTIKSELILKEKSWQANVEKIKTLI